MPVVETAFSALRIEGGLLPPEFLQHIAALDARGQSPAEYAIPPGRTVRDEIGRYWTIAAALWDEYSQNRARTDIKSERTGVERWLIRLLREVLGYTDITACPAPVVTGDRSSPSTHRACGGAVPLLLTTEGYELDRSSRQFAEERRRSPHAALQEFLSADEASLWGILGNGPRLRLLRDNPSLTRPAYIEADLERMFEEGLYADFAAFWLLAHSSRLAPGPEGMAGARIEEWRAEGAETGQRALQRLRIGVTAALRALGCGFVEHKDNEALRAALCNGEAASENLYQQLLRLIYRLLFLFTSEDRELLLAPTADAAARGLYASGYSLSRLRDKARLRRSYDRYADLWRGLTVTFRGLARGAEPLGLPALGGLFEPDQCPLLDGASLGNERLLTAIHALAFFETEGGLQRVNYRDMGTEELGSVYEALLELHPVVQVAAMPWSFSFLGDESANGEGRGSERRLSGSYYTPDALVQEVLRSTLDPLIKRKLHDNPADPRAALLCLRVLDPACGSGHFLLGAARHLAAQMARLDSDDDLPDEAVRRHALREVVRRCIYGVDRNPLSVELCRTALWIEAVEPGMPLSFLDAHIRCGDALVGVSDLAVLAEGIPDQAFVSFVGDTKAAVSAFRRTNKAQREAPAPSLDLGISLPEDLAATLDALAEEEENTVEAVARKRQLFEKLHSGGVGRQLKIACDLWTAAFFAIKTIPEITGRELCPTTDTVWRYLGGNTLHGPMMAEVDRLAQYYRFFHWPLEFPEVARDGGFDLIVGNPPWETTSPDAKEFFAPYDPQVRFMSSEQQKQAFERLKEHPGIRQRWETYCRDLYTQTNFYKGSGRYRMFAPGNLGKGDLNVYRMFVETALAGVRGGGCAAQLAPEGLYNGANAAAIRATIFQGFRLDRLIGFENSRGVWFPEVDTRTKFCLYVAWKDHSTESFQAAFRVNSERRLAEAAKHTMRLPVSLVREFSPDALAVMEFTSQVEVDICRKMYARYPKFGQHIEGLPNRVYMREVDMGNDRDLFSEGPDGLPVFEGRMVDLYDYRAKGYGSGRGRAAEWPDLPFGDPRKAIAPQWRILPDRVPEKLVDRINQYRIGFCDVASPTNERSLVAALIPRGAVCGHKVPTIVFESGVPADLILWLGIANSIVIDFVIRKKVALAMSYTIMDTLPFPRDWRSTPGAEEIVARAYALSAVGPEMDAFRQSTPGTPGIPLGIEAVEDPTTRARLRAEIDVLVARDVYGLTRDELRYVLDPDTLLGEGSGVETFKALRNREKRTYHEYRTQRLILEAWERLPHEGVPSAIAAC